MLFQGLLAKKPSEYLSSEAAEAAKELEQWQVKALKLDQKIQAVSDMLKDDECDFEAVRENLKTFKTEKNVIEETIKELQQKTAIVSSMPANIEELYSLVKQDLEDNEIRRKIANLMPQLLTGIQFSFGDKPSFEVQLTNGFSWQVAADWTDMSKPFHLFIKAA